MGFKVEIADVCLNRGDLFGPARFFCKMNKGRT